jgi:predicted transcriptional regulator of viral defense system
MKYYEIKQKLDEVRVFSVEDLYTIDPKFRVETLYEWERKGWVKKLRNKKYVFADFQPVDVDLYLVANKLYEPSYISLELALNHYGIIPEAVMRITSVTTNKTLSVETSFGVFDYRTLDRRLFFGYKIVIKGTTTYKIASLEKALIDYLYLNSQITRIADIEGLRFNKDILRERLDQQELEKIVAVYDNEALKTRVGILLNYLKT